MVMIVKDHEKHAHGFISVTRYAPLPRSPADSDIGYREWPRAQLAAVDAGPWPVPRPGVRSARTLALGLHCSEQ
jgi:hypothetical protein